VPVLGQVDISSGDRLRARVRAAARRRYGIRAVDRGRRSRRDAARDAAAVACSALAATLSTRLVPVLARDARRMAAAQRCRADEAPSRAVLLRAVTSSALDRALDLAATLESAVTRARRPPRRHEPWSRPTSRSPRRRRDRGHRLRGARGGLTDFNAYPSIDAAPLAGVVATSAAIAVCALLPFADRRGIG
jgi:energy-coupling factor transport system permease protein